MKKDGIYVSVLLISNSFGAKTPYLKKNDFVALIRPHRVLAFGFKLMHVRITTTSHPNSSSRLESNSVTIRSEHNVSIFW